MALSATELWSQKETTQEANTWGAARYFSVIGTTTELLDELAVVNCPGTPAIGSSHPRFRDLRVVNKSAGPGLAERTLTVRYQWMPQGWNPKDSNTDPLSRVPRITWGTGFTTEPWLFDVYGNPITNSAFDALANPPQKEKYFKTLRITRWERNYDIRLATMFEGKINAKDIVSGNVTFRARTVKCTAIAPVSEYGADESPLQIAYDFQLFSTAPTTTGNRLLPWEIARDPFKHWFLDSGLRGYSGASGANPGDFTYESSGERVSDEILLNGYGAPMEPSKYQVNAATPVNNPGKLPTTIAKVFLPSFKAWALGYDVAEAVDFAGMAL